MKINKEMLISADRHETRVAILENSKLMEIYIQPVEKKSLVGNIYLGTVQDILPGIEAAFVDIGLPKNGFLYREEAAIIEDEAPLPKIEYLLKPKQDLLVQILKEPLGTKGARVTTHIAIPGRYLVILPYDKDTFGISRKLPDEERERLKAIVEQIKPRNLGVIVRTAAEGEQVDDLKKDLQQLRRIWNGLSRKIKKAKPVELIYEEPTLELKAVRDWFSEDFSRLIVDSKEKFNNIIAFLRRHSPKLVEKVTFYNKVFPLFEKYDIDKEIRKALKRRVWLKSGGYIAIDHTEALTAIDVNTGKFIGKKSLRQTVLKTNLEAAKEIVRQIRLRDIGGIIVIDFIDMADPKDRDQVFNTFNNELASDRIKSRVIEISKIGLVEMTRKSTSENLIKATGKACTVCMGAGLILSDRTVSIAAERAMRKEAKTRPSKAFLFKAHPAIVSNFREQIVKNLKRDTGKAVFIVSDPTVEQETPVLMSEGQFRKVEEEFERFEHETEI